MAHGVKYREGPKLHQTLHGYADGHRQLAGSATLKPRDTKTMLVLSDISGPGARIDEMGYLTGYPLAESGVYALARTWAAPEMPRPGCAWTHTLLIDFADLATLASLADLIPLFKRPRVSSFSDYGTVLTLGDESDGTTLTDAAKTWSRRVLTGLYEKPSSRVVAVRPAGIEVDPVVLAIWSQQWPRLRRGFRFCTLAAADRSSDGHIFDLQLLPSMDRSVRTRFPGAFDTEDAESSTRPWLDDALTDLARPDALGLRSFLRRIGADVATGRDAFRPLCQLHQLVDAFKSRPEAIDDAIALLQDELGSVQARAARAIVANAALDQADELDDDALDFLLQHLELVDADALARSAVRVGRAVWSRDPGRLVPMLEAGGPLQIVPERTLRALRADEVAQGLRQAPALMQAALGHRPDIVTEPAFWSRDVASDDGAFAVIAQANELRASALTALIIAQRDDLSARAVRELGASEVLRAVALEFARNSGDAPAFYLWVAAAAADPSAVAQFLADDPALPRALLVTLAHAIPPDAVPNDYGVDPWLSAVRNASGAVSEGVATFLNA
jgi:hypothetical protein